MILVYWLVTLIQTTSCPLVVNSEIYVTLEKIQAKNEVLASFITHLTVQIHSGSQNYLMKKLKSDMTNNSFLFKWNRTMLEISDKLEYAPWIWAYLVAK